jgi:hypothetical protein
VFAAWGEYSRDLRRRRRRAVATDDPIHVTTASGTREMISPLGIADGNGDAWLIALNHACTPAATSPTSA